ncbi:MAG: prepilin-type N-terminal cleavage/methylation domain-containing protein [Verrucomicrobiota bacterium]
MQNQVQNPFLLNDNYAGRAWKLQSLKAFTLVELLVVIVILGLLVGLAVPATLKVREKGQEAQCINNLRSLQLANEMYATDNDGVYVAAYTTDSTGSLTQWYSNLEYRDMLASVLDLDNRFSWSKELLCPVAYQAKENRYDSITASYGINRNALITNGGMSGSNSSSAIRAANISRPSQTVAFADATDWQVKSSALSAWTGREGQQGNSAVAYRHNGRCHVVFYDGHVSKLTMAEATAPENAHLWTYQD